MMPETSRSNRPEISSTRLPEELERRLGHDLILKELIRDGGLPTVKDYIDLNWGGELPEEIDVEDAETLDAIARFEASLK